MKMECLMKQRIPVAHRVLVKLDKIDAGEQRSEAGIILRSGLTESEIHREMSAQDEGIVEAIGHNAFKDFGDGTPWCEIGDKVFIVRYSGANFIDEDTKEMFRIVNDADIYAIIRES